MGTRDVRAYGIYALDDDVACLAVILHDRDAAIAKADVLATTHGGVFLVLDETERVEVTLTAQVLRRLIHRTETPDQAAA